MKSIVKKSLSLLVLAFFLQAIYLAPNAKIFAAELPGSGTETNPYRISTVDDLVQLRTNVNGSTNTYKNQYIKLMNDIDLTEHLAEGGPGNNNGTGWQPIGKYNSRFEGSFDGDGHKITGLWAKMLSTEYTGLFSWVFDCEIKNLGVEIDGTLKGSNYTGGLVGSSDGSTITNCYTTGNVSGGDGSTGGLVGFSGSSTITNCYTTGNVSGGDIGDTGGLVGLNRGGTITNCYTTGNVSDGSYTGGLIGNNVNGTITNCYTTGNVSDGSYTGGLVGLNGNGGSIKNCYSTGNVSAFPAMDSIVGGLVGINRGSIITDCYTTGNVSGGNGSTGGLVGLNDVNGTITNCYSTGEVLFANSASVGGLVGISMGLITNCHATGDLTSRPVTFIFRGQVAGFIGENNGTIKACSSSGNVAVDGTITIGGFVGNNSSTISECYSTGNINNPKAGLGIGGFAGILNNNTTTQNCYSTGSIDIKNNSPSGGFVGTVNTGAKVTNCYSAGEIVNGYGGGFAAQSLGQHSGCYFLQEPGGINDGLSDVLETPGKSGIYPKTKTQLQQQATFDGWDYNDIWGNVEDRTYPFLRAFGNKYKLDYKNYDGRDLPSLDPIYNDFNTYFVRAEGNYPTENKVALPTTPPYDFSGYDFIGWYDKPLDTNIRVPVQGYGSGLSNTQVDFSLGTKFIDAPQNDMGDFNLYARYNSNLVYTENEGKEFYLIGPAGAFPNGSTARITKLLPGTDEFNKAISEIEEKESIENIKMAEFKVFDSAGNEIQPNKSFGLVTLGFKVPQDYDQEDLKAWWVKYGAKDIEYQPIKWQDPATGEFFVEILVDHFTPFALIDTLSDRDKKTLKTGYDDLNYFGVLGFTSLLCAAAYIYLKKKILH